MALLKRYYIFFLCVNIFLPKINLGFGSFYFFEFINLFLLILLIVRGKVLINGVTLTYLIFIFICYVSFLFGALYFSFFDTNSFARLVKFTFFLFYLLVPYVILDKLSERDFLKVINYQVLFFVVAGVYVIFHMVTEPKSMSEYIWGYDNRYRLIGLTGYALDLQGNLERLEGTTSVSMGVYISFVFLIFLARYHFFGGKGNLIKISVLFVLEFLVYSRSGLLVMAVGLLYFFILNSKPATIFKFSLLALTVTSVIVYFNLAEKITTAGSLSKVVNMSITEDPRYRMLQAATEHVERSPASILIGAGFGEEYLYRTVGYRHLEGLLPTTLISSGIFAIAALCLHFLFVWYYARHECLNGNNQYTPFLYAVRLFVPGWALTAFISGNTFQTDFYFPVIYFIFLGAYYLSKRERMPAAQAT